MIINGLTFITFNDIFGQNDFWRSFGEEINMAEFFPHAGSDRRKYTTARNPRREQETAPHQFRNLQTA